MSFAKIIPVTEDEIGMRVDRWFKQHYPDLKHGRLDMIVERKNLRSTISNVIKILLKIEEKNINANDSNVVTIDDPLRKSTA